MASHLGPWFSKQVPEDPNFQTRNSRIYKAVFTSRGVGHVARFQRCLLSDPFQTEFKEVPRIPSSEFQSFQFTALHFGPSTAPMEFTRSQTHGTGRSFPDPPVPGRLINQSLRQTHLCSRYSVPPRSMTGARLGSQFAKNQNYIRNRSHILQDT